MSQFVKTMRQFARPELMRLIQAGVLGSAMSLAVGCTESPVESTSLSGREPTPQTPTNEAQIASLAAEATRLVEQATVFGQLEEFENAIKAFTKALSIDPNRARAYSGRALVYVQLKNYEEAIKDCDRAIELDPHDAAAFRNRGLALFELQKHDQALADLNTSIRQQGEVATSYFRRGNVYAALKKYDRAIEDYTQAIQLDSNFALALQCRAIAYALIGDRVRAESDFAAAHQLDINLRPEWPKRQSTETASEPPVIQQVSASVQPSLSAASQSTNRIARAIAVAVREFESAKCRVETLPESSSWQLRCQNDSEEFFVLVKLLDDSETPAVEVTQSEIEAASKSTTTVRVAVVTGVTDRSPTAPDRDNTTDEAGRVVKVIAGEWFRDQWLTPIRYRLSAN